MSFVIAAPETMAVAAADLAGIESALSAARAAAAPQGRQGRQRRPLLPTDMATGSGGTGGLLLGLVDTTRACTPTRTRPLLRGHRWMNDQCHEHFSKHQHPRHHDKHRILAPQHCPHKVHRAQGARRTAPCDRTTARIRPRR
ncbi:MAG: PE family protein [Mycobacterium sp.]